MNDTSRPEDNVNLTVRVPRSLADDVQEGDKISCLREVTESGAEVVRGPSKFSFAVVRR